MAQYGIELNPTIKSFKCPHCGEESITIWGSVSKDKSAHAVYYANLMTGHQETSARMTISVGGWGDRADENDRRWVFIEARPTADRYEMMIREPEESFYHQAELLGTPLTRAQALESSLKDEFFAVADCIAFNDPAVKSYLLGEEVSSEGRA
jgi:hypothetical protein